MRKWFVFLCLHSILLSSCYAARIDGPYRGRVIDADTREPIEGVVVLGTWDREYPTAAGAIHKFYDARETVTDKNGDFEIKGLGVLVMSNITPMNVLIFKVGYTRFGLMTWNELIRTVKVEDNRAVVRLKKLTMEEREKQGSISYPTEVPEEKAKLMLKEINKDRIERRLKPIGRVAK